MPSSPEGWHGWDEYAPFYDWENARTLGRRDVAFWQRVARREHARTLELGCGTGRLLLPVSRTGVRAVGLDRSVPMLARARQEQLLGGARVALLTAHRLPAPIEYTVLHKPLPAERLLTFIANALAASVATLRTAKKRGLSLSKATGHTAPSEAELLAHGLVSG